MTKSIFTSRTFWVNVLTGLGTVAGMLSDTLPPQAAPYIVIANNVINIGLRWITTQPVSIKP